MPSDHPAEHQIERGWAVFDANGRKLATVETVCPSRQFLFARRGLVCPRVFYLPFSGIDRVEPRRVALNMVPEQIERLDWDGWSVAQRCRGSEVSLETKTWLETWLSA